MAQITENPARVGARNRAGNNLNGSSYIIDFRSINQAAVPALPAILARLLPGGKIGGGEYVVRNPTRADHRPGSFKINVRTGHWADFATGDRGGDPISLVAYTEGMSQGEAARMLARMLGLETGGRRNE
jgi:hypothetical protein